MQKNWKRYSDRHKYIIKERKKGAKWRGGDLWLIGRPERIEGGVGDRRNSRSKKRRERHLSWKWKRSDGREWCDSWKMKQGKNPRKREKYIYIKINQKYKSTSNKNEEGERRTALGRKEKSVCQTFSTLSASFCIKKPTKKGRKYKLINRY